MCALYGFARVCDDLGDDRHTSEQAKAENLERWRADLSQALAGDPSGHPVLPAIVDVVQRFAIPAEHLHAVIDGMESDLNFAGFETFPELEHYCYQVAGAVGLCCVRIWGCDVERAVQPAIACGTAFQLTNILRDLGEDVAMERVYLPRDELAQFGYTLADLKGQRRNDAFHALMQFQVDRAESYYVRARELFECLSPPGRSILAAMLGIYGGLLQAVARCNYDVFSHRVTLSRSRKLWIVARSFVRHRIFRL